MGTDDRNWNRVRPGAAGTGEALEANAPEAFDHDLDADDDGDGESFGAWWARLPDFMKPRYPFDLPPERLPFARTIFTGCGAPARCPQDGCRRSMECGGGDGPPCFRADRKPLHQMLFLSYMALFGPATDEEACDALRRSGNPYRWPFDGTAPPRARGRARRRRRGRSVVSPPRSP